MRADERAPRRGLGAYDTFVQTPSGLDGWQQLTSAYDMTLFLRAALAQPRFLRLRPRARRRRCRPSAIGGAGPVPMWNQNVQFLTTVTGALAAKTGFTDAAQHTFAGAIERHGHRYGVVLMRAQRWPDDQWVQATKLVAWASRCRPAPPAGRAARRAGGAGPRRAASASPPVAASGTRAPSASPSGTTADSSNSGVRDPAAHRAVRRRRSTS